MSTVKLPDFAAQAFLLFLVVAGAGCGGKKLHQVKGTVEYADGADNSVLARGMVLFGPVDIEVNKLSSRGVIQADGSFVMSTSKEGDGVAPGTYRVMVTPPPFSAGRDRDKEPPQLLDPSFRSFETSGLEITVDKAMNDYVIKVRKP